MLKAIRNIIIFRNQLFKVSEPFITNQAESLNLFHPVYVGRKIFGLSPNGSDVISLEQHSFITNLFYVLFRNVSRYKALVKKYDPVLIHAHFGVEGIYAMKLSKSLDIPLITTFHGFDATTTTLSLIKSGKPAWLNYALYKNKLIKNGELFICVSDSIRDNILSMGFPAEKTLTHYIGIDVSHPPQDKKAMPYKTILHVARLTEKKGSKYLIEAFSIIAKEDNQTKLVIIGDGPLMFDLQKQVNLLGLSERVKFLGSQPNTVVMEWMTKSDIFCLPSVTAQSGDAEGLGMVLLEAGSEQVPIVATKHGGFQEAVIDGETGYLVTEKNSIVLAEKLIFLLRNENLRLTMGRNARKLIEMKFNLKTQTEKLEQIYKTVLR